MVFSSPAFVLTERADVLGFVPYVLGFHPADSLVLIGLSDKRIIFGARADADWPIAESVRQLSMVLSRQPDITGVLVLGYGPADLVNEPTLAVSSALADRGYPALETLRVDKGRYYCLRCADCTPADGTAFDIESSAGAALGTYAGRVVRPDRAAVEAQVRPLDGPARVAMRQAVDRAEERFAELALPQLPRSATPASAQLRGGPRRKAGEAAVRLAGETAVEEALRRAELGERLDDDEVAWLSLLLLDLPCRDHAWLRTDSEEWQLEFWLDLTRRCEPTLAAPVATLLGWCAWRSGDGVLASAALERALETDPGYSLAEMLMDALARGLPPSAVGSWPAKPGRTGRRGRAR
jgi:hypothetical protein